MALTAKIRSNPSEENSAAPASDRESVGLIDRHKDGLATTSQALGDLLVERDHALPHVDHHDDQVCGLNGQVDLIHRGFDDYVGRGLPPEQPNAAGVDQGEGVSLPFEFGGDSVPGHPWLIMHDRDPPPGNTVEER